MLRHKESQRMELPRIISVDDHVIDPPDLWTSRIPARFHDRAPRVVRKRGAGFARRDGKTTVLESPDAKWADVWLYDDLATPITAGIVAVGPPRDLIHSTFM